MESDQFELNGDLIDQIIFAMENQKEKFYLDSHVPSVIPADSTGNIEGKIYDLPDWEPSDGYRLMELFVLTLRNPVFREHLSSILHCGSGVFRKYKDALNQRPDIERKWFAFKEKNMKEKVLDWYNSLRLEWGLDIWDMEFNGEYSPVLTDFSIAEETGENLGMISMLDREAFAENYSSFPDDYTADLFRRHRDGFEPEVSEDSKIFIAESPDGELGGFLWITTEMLEGGTLLGRIRQIFILPEYRGLGLAEMMKERALEDPRLKSCDILEIEVPAAADFLQKSLTAMGFVKNGTLHVYREKSGEEGD